MRNIILILGDLASGKSTLADSLSAKLNYICLKKDTFKENISDVIGFNNREENKKISKENSTDKLAANMTADKIDKSVFLTAITVLSA